MERSKHVRRVSFVPASPSRWVAATVGAWGLVATVAGDQSRYTCVVDLTLALVLVAVGTLPAEYRVRARAVVLGLMTVFFTLAGVVASLSIDEAMTLVVGAIVAGIMACFFGAVPHHPAHAASASAS